MANPFRGSIAIVTGGSSGIGRALCLELGRRGAFAAVADIDEEGARKAAAAIVEDGGVAQSILLDVTDADAVERMIHEIDRSRGGIDYMFNNAGIGLSGEAIDLAREHWRRIMEVNFFGVLNGTLAAYAAMARRGRGHIVNMSSLAGFAPFVFNAPYTAAKFAVTGMTEALRVEAEARGVKVTLVCPGIVRTPFYESIEIVGTDPDSYRARLPRRLISPERAAAIILRGVAAGKRRIIFPLHARLAWWAGKLAPFAIDAMNRRLVREFRECSVNQRNISSTHSISSP